MDTLAKYRAAINEIIADYAQYPPSVGEVEVEVIFAEAQDHYELRHTGWIGTSRVEGSVIHIDIRGGKIWIQHDGTERGVALDLVDRGLAKDQIVLAFKSPERRRLTDFAVS